MGLYHGSARPLTGTHIVPGDKSGYTLWGDHEQSSAHAWATDSPTAAHSAAAEHSASLRTVREHGDNPAYRESIHEVHPASDMRLGPLSDSQFKEFKSSQGFQRTGHVEDTPPGWQRSFPTHNWNAHARSGVYSFGESANAEPVEHGLGVSQPPAPREPKRVKTRSSVVGDRKPYDQPLPIGDDRFRRRADALERLQQF